VSPVRVVVAAVLIALLAWVVVAWVMAQQYRDVVAGSGPIITQQRSLSPFTRVSASGKYEIAIRAGAPQAVAVEAQPNVAGLIETTVSDGTLVISERKRFTTRRKTVIKIDVQRLEAVSLNGQVDASVTGVQGASLALSSNGAGSFTVTGSVQTLSVTSRGAGAAHLEGLHTRDATVAVFGAGDAELAVSDSLSVQIFGAGSVTYRGSPRVQKTIRGAGTVEHV
jgi:putative autotransporter adhesin-like protein